MNLVYNHKAQKFNSSLLVSDSDASEIIEVCENYFGKIANSVILQRVMNWHGLNGCIFASYILGQLIAAQKAQSEMLNNSLQWQKLN